MKCELCGSNRRDSIKYGEFLTKNGKGVHTNCLVSIYMRLRACKC